MNLENEKWIKVWSGGLTHFEISAIEKIEKAFCSQNNTQSMKENLSSLQDLKKAFNVGMYPWRGYAGFRFVDSTGREGEFDLVLITHYKIFIIELKHWNGRITCSNDKWYLNGEDRGRSPVSITQSKVYLIRNKLERFKNKFTNAGYVPFVDFLVVLTGNANIDALTESERHHVIQIEDFLKLNNKEDFYNRFGRPHHSKSESLNRDFAIFDEIFGVDYVKQKQFSINGYVVEEDADFTHPREIYQEFLAKSEVAKYQDSDLALVRRWDFDKVSNGQAKTSDGRYRLVTREYDVLEAIKVSDEDLFSYCLNYKKPPSKIEITSDYVEVFGILPNNKRFNNFIEQLAKNMQDDDRVRLAVNLLDKFARLHKAGIAHRDIGAHCVWISGGGKVTLSGFVSAYFPKEGTVGDIREILSVSKHKGLIDQNNPLKNKLTAYEEDVQALAILIWHLIRAERISQASLEGFADNLNRSEEWYANILRKALTSSSYNDATELLDDFQNSKPKQQLDFSFDYKKLEPYIRPINLVRTYRDDKFLKEEDDKEVYISGDRVVKAWLNIQYMNDESMAREIYKFMEKSALLQSLSPEYMPRIHDFGIAQKSTSLYLVSDYIEGYTWIEISKLEMSLEQKFEAINKLVHAIEHLHGLGFAHGDLHSENLMFVADEQLEARLFILDLLDFSPLQKNNLNYHYSPSAAENSSEIERDNFAVMRLSSELLGIEWGKSSDEFPELSKALLNEISDPRHGFMTLERFKAALLPQSLVEWIDVSIGAGNGISETCLIYPDNGSLYIKFEVDERKSDEIKILFYGVGGVLETIYSIRSDEFLAFKSKFRNREIVSNRVKADSVAVIPIGINVKYSNKPNVSKINNIFKPEGLLYDELQDFITSLKRNKNDGFNNNKDDIGDAHTKENDDDKVKRFRPETRVLWDKIISTEIESLPSITPIHFGKKDEVHYLSYECDMGNYVLDGMDGQDIVDLIARNPKTDKDIFIASIDIQQSNSKILQLKQEPKNQWVLDQGLPIFLQSRESKASFNRRKKALARILNNESVIKNLSLYFDDSRSISETRYDVKIQNEDFKRYDREGVSLNKTQRDAFHKLLRSGPVSLLQGPPGTGKTEFIAAFVHFLFEKQKVKNVLLVSQSHEAVNTTAERIRRHCLRLDTPLQIVRFSNRESAVSPELQDVFSQNLISAKREALKASQLKRLMELGEVIGLPPEYMRLRANIEIDIGEKIQRYQRLRNEQPNISNFDKSEYAKACDMLLDSIQNSLSNLGRGYLDINLNEVLQTIIGDIDRRYSVSSKSSKQTKQLIDLSKEMISALANERVGYDEFLARSRQLVVGTCVGIGQSHIGIGETIYDWVIVDEAARSVSSELAIAMQAGKRILLVGDHKQLPPLYQEGHKKALAQSLRIPAKGEELDYILGSDFERAFESNYGKKVGASLKTQYRMAPAIGTLVSKCFYDGDLVNGKLEEQVSDVYLSLPEHFHPTVTWLSTNNLPNAFHTQSQNGGLSNTMEAELIIKLLKDIEESQEFMQSEVAQQCLKKGEAAIGVICMYSEQKNLLRKKLNEKPWRESFKDLVKIDTVDSYQGKENHIIILSVTRYDKSKSIGFLSLPNRINVALSRAMDRLIIVGATSTWLNNGTNHPLGRVLKLIMQKSECDDKSYAVIPAESIN